jgi:hypothetical protein
VTTWAEDLEHATATGEWSAVGTSNPAGRVEAEKSTELPPVTDDSSAAASGPAPEDGEHAAAQPDDPVAEEERLAVERAEAERIDAERAAAQQAEDERLEQLRAAGDDAESGDADIERVEPDERWLEAERAEAERIDAEQAAAQRAEDERLERLRAEHVRQREEDAVQAEHERLEGIRAAAEQAERDRLDALWREERGLAGHEPQLTDEAAPQAPVEAAVQTAAPPRPMTSATPAQTTEPIPRFIEFRSTSLLRYVFGAFFVVFAVAAVIAIFRAVSPGDSSLAVAAAGLTALAMLSWWALLSWAPPVVSISDGTLEISRGTRTTSWDLRDPSTEITLRGRPSSRSWRAVLRDPAGRTAVITGRHVDPAQFVEVVEHYQSLGQV